MAKLKCGAILILTHTFFLQTPSWNGVNAVYRERKFCRNPGEHEETENEIPCAQVNQKRAKKTNKPPIETRKAKLPFDVRPAISSKSNQRNGKRPRDEHEKSAKTAARDEHEKPTKTAASSNTKKARQDDEQSSSIQGKISSSNQSIAKLQSHLEKSTCPKTLRYSVRANITPDDDFKKEIGSIRNKAEQALVGA